MMDQHRSEYFAIPSEAFHPAFFSLRIDSAVRSSATAMASHSSAVLPSQNVQSYPAPSRAEYIIALKGGRTL